MRKVLTIVALIVIVGMIVMQLGRLRDPKIFPPDDFVEYWSAGKLTLRGDNPYDPKLLKPLQEDAGRFEDFTVMMWNPPWTLTFVMPYATLHPYDAKVVWFLQNFLLLLLSADWLWRIYEGPKRYRWVAWLLALTYIPSLLALGVGQIPPMILFGVTLFLAMEKQGYPYLAGLAGVLMAIKPHMVYLFWPALAVSSLFRGWKIVIGGIVGGIVASAIPMYFRSQVFKDFWIEITQRPPEQWITPTLGTGIRFLESGIRGIPAKDAFALSFVPVLFGAIWLIWYGWQSRKEKWDWRERMPLILLVSFFFAPYGAWHFDLLILFVAVIPLAIRILQDPNPNHRRVGLITWCSLNGLMLIMNLTKAPSFCFVWVAPTMLALYIWLKRYCRESALEHVE